MSSRRRKNLMRIIVTAGAFLAVLLTEHFWPFRGVLDPVRAKFVFTALYSILYIYVGHDVLVKAVRNAISGQVFSENLLMSIATVCAVILGAEHEAVTVMLFYQIGEWFQGHAVSRSRDSVKRLVDLRRDVARVIRDGSEIVVSPREVAVGEVIAVFPGERIPLDGRVILGDSALDCSALTGEAIPSEVGIGALVYSGTVNLTSTIKIEVTKVHAESTAMKILELITSVSSKKSVAENFISRFSRFYTPAVVCLAVLLFIIGGAVSGDFSVWGYRALSFLVVSCPCALVVSVPLAFFAGIGGASSCGILVKGSGYLERLANVSVFVFDKTGTITEGIFEVIEVCPEERREEILALASAAERESSHPLARSIVRAYGREVDCGYTLLNLGGMGVKASGEGGTLIVGNNKLMQEQGIDVEEERDDSNVVHVARNGEYLGYIVLIDKIKAEARDVVGELKRAGARTVMLSGDRVSRAREVADMIGIDEVRASLLPDGKVAELEKIMSSEKGGAVCFIGDGINDAPSIMRSDVGISMGAMGSDASIEASDVVIMRDDLKKLPLAVKIAKRTMTIVRENVVFSLGIKALALVLSALGITSLWISVFADVGVAFLAVLNAGRARLISEEKAKICR